MLLIWDLKDSVLSRMTPRLLTWGKDETEELSIVSEKLSVLDKVDLVPMRRTWVLLMFNLRTFRVNQVFISEMQSVREGGGRVDEGLVVR